MPEREDRFNRGRDMVAMPKASYEEIVEKLRSIDDAGQKAQELLDESTKLLQRVDATLTVQALNQLWEETLASLEATGVSHMVPRNLNTTISANSTDRDTEAYEIPDRLCCMSPRYTIEVDRTWDISYKLTLNLPSIRDPSRGRWRNFLVEEENICSARIDRIFPRIPKTSIAFEYITNSAGQDVKLNFHALGQFMPEEAGAELVKFVSDTLSDHLPEEVLR